MPWSLVYGERRRIDKWRHPMERISNFYFELEFAITMLHMLPSEWQKASQEDKSVCMAWYRLHLEREGYYNTPKDERFDYFGRS